MVGGDHEQEATRRAYQERKRRQKRNVPFPLRLHARNGRETFFTGKRENRAHSKTYLWNAGKRFNAEKDSGYSERRKGFNAQRLQDSDNGYQRREKFGTFMEYFRSSYYAFQPSVYRQFSSTQINYNFIQESQVATPSRRRLDNRRKRTRSYYRERTMGQSERSRKSRRTRQAYTARLYAPAVGTDVLRGLRRENAVRLEYAERHSVF